MLRRYGLGLALTIALGAYGSPPPANAQTVELKLSHYLPPNHTVHKFLEAWAAELAERSGGRLVVKIFPTSQLGPVQRQFDLARSGQADLAVGLVGATPGRYPLTELANLPFMWPKEGSSSAITSERLTELAPKYLAKEFEGVHILWFGITPTNSLFTARREITKLQDIQGLKLRFQGEQQAKALRLLGAVPLQVPPGEIADGMSKGVIDGAVFNCEAAESFGLGSIAHYVSQQSFFTATLGLVMNAARYDSLPADLRDILDASAGAKAAGRVGQLWDAAEQHGREYMLANNAVMKPLPPAELDAVKARLAPLTEESIQALEKNGKPAKAFVEDYRN
jgi:TRAP-type C4-dicarboxylate transport system substrate-binding protein